MLFRKGQRRQCCPWMCPGTHPADRLVRRPEHRECGRPQRDAILAHLRGTTRQRVLESNPKYLKGRRGQATARPAGKAAAISAPWENSR